jgi:uracil DNA glycosylase
MDILDNVPADWRDILPLKSSNFKVILKRLQGKETIYPPIKDIFNFTSCSWDDIRVVLLSNSGHNRPGSLSWSWASTRLVLFCPTRSQDPSQFGQYLQGASFGH